ncbi:MAG: protein phosphatase 2C domain-containing protein [Kiloniellales bacterium]
MDESTQGFRYVVSSGTDVGRVRSLNEDALLDRGDIGLWVVADGMGGHAAGDFASRAIVEALGQVAPPTDGSSFLRDVEERIQDTHAALRQESRARGSGGIIGSTVVALLAWDRHYACVWAGDSRLYLLRDGELRQVSRDHSLVQDLVDAGELAPEQAESHPQANVVTRAVGAVEDLVLDKTHEQISIGDMFLLCSDGLTRHVSDQEIAAVLIGETAPGAAQVLIDLALERGARDNVTTVVVRCELEDGASGDPGGDPGGGPGAEPLPEAWDEDSETTMPVRAPFHATGGATDTGPAMEGGSSDVPGDAPDDLGLEPVAGALDPEPIPAPGAASEDPLAGILADGPADRAPGAGAADMADDLVLGRGRDPLDLAEDSDPLLAAGPPAGPGAARASAASGGKTPAEWLAGPLSGRGIPVGLLLCVGVVALAAAAYVLYSILTLS